MGWLKNLLGWLLGSKPTSGRVEKIIDGDSLLARTSEGLTEIRIRGADAPEMDQPDGRQAKAELTELALGKTIELEDPEIDHYGRTAANVSTECGNDLAAEMVRRGMAWADPQRADARHELAEETAQEAKRGIWGRKEKPKEPWKHREEDGPQM